MQVVLTVCENLITHVRRFSYTRVQVSLGTYADLATHVRTPMHLRCTHRCTIGVHTDAP